VAPKLGHSAGRSASTAFRERCRVCENTPGLVDIRYSGFGYRREEHPHADVAGVPSNDDFATTMRARCCRPMAMTLALTGRLRKRHRHPSLNQRNE